MIEKNGSWNKNRWRLWICELWTSDEEQEDEQEDDWRDKDYEQGTTIIIRLWRCEWGTNNDEYAMIKETIEGIKNTGQLSEGIVG